MHGTRLQYLFNRRNQQMLFYISIFVHLYYYISAFFTHSLDPLYVWAATGGMDFFQIPNGAYAFAHGGSLTGLLINGLAPFAHGYCCGVNANVYHPLFTLLIGFPLVLFKPEVSMAVWAGVHLLVTAGLVYFLWKKFHTHPYIYLALSLFLLFSYHYYEIWLDQYHFLFNFFTILFLYESTAHGDCRKAGWWLFLSLLVKPIGLLWILPLLLYRRFKTVGIGFGLFTLVTIAVTVYPFTFGKYYLTNFFSVATDLRPSANLYALKWLLPAFPLQVIHEISLLAAVGLIILQLVKRPPLYTIISLWIGFQLLFYGLVFHYHYTILAGIICLGILYNQITPRKLIFIPVMFLTLPALPVVFFHLSAQGLARSTLAYVWLYSAFWLCFLLGSMVYAELRKKPQ